MVEEAYKPRNELLGEFRGGKGYYDSDSTCFNSDMATP